MGYRLGDAVWFLSNFGPKKVERAGYVVGIVPPNEIPHPYVPADLTCKLAERTRPQESYLVRVPGVIYVLWPFDGSLNLMTEEKQYIFKEQSTAMRHFLLKQVDRTDRHKLKGLCKFLGDDFRESKEMFEVPEWRKRFYFSVDRGVEYIRAVDQW